MDTIVQVIVWLITGALVGTAVGALVKRTKSGYGRYGNLGIGLAGALIGGSLFRLLGIDLGLGRVSISLEDLVAAFVGSLIFLLIVWVVRQQKG